MERGIASCPGGAQLRALLHDSSLTETEQRELVKHLDDCPSCQTSLESLATGDWTWQPELAQAPTVPPSDSAYWPAVGELKRAPAKFTPASDPNALTAAVAEPPSERELTLDFLDPPEHPGALGKLERFHVLEVVGRGGMGIVFKALDECLQRFVALKVLDPVYARNEIARQRFCREARTGASIAHENVTAIHQVEIDEKHDLPYIVMQFVKGISLQQRLDEGKPLELKSILRIGMQTAAGLAAAHREGLVHRDIKPANILLEEGLDRVRLTDFGLARAVEDVKLTQTGFVAGTPLYMAPEQARGEQLDHRTDLFSLGSVLYAMCTGRPPFEGNTPFNVLKQVTDQFPTSITKLNPDIPVWLSELIERLHEKNPNKRPQSADEVATLLAQHLAVLQADAGLPAVMPSLRCTRAKVIKKTLFLGAAVGILFSGLFVGSEFSGLTNLIRSRKFASGAGGGVDFAPVVLPTGPEALASLGAQGGPTWSIAYGGACGRLVAADDDGSVKLWDVQDKKLVHTFRKHKGPVWGLALAPDGGQIASGGEDGVVRIWECSTGAEVTAIEVKAGIRSIAFSPNGKRLAVGLRNGAVSMYDAKTFKPIWTEQSHTGVCYAVAFNKEGSTLASAGGDKKVRLINAENGQEQTTLYGAEGPLYCVAFDHSGNHVAAGGWDGAVRIWSAMDGVSVAALRRDPDVKRDILSIAYSGDDSKIVTGSDDGGVRVWNVKDRTETAVFRGHDRSVTCVAYAEDGTLIISSSRDGSVRMWDPATIEGLQN